MFKSKRDVDRHVSYILNRIRNEKERNARGYGIAKLYVDIGEFEWGKRYLDSYMSVRETLPDAHKLMGRIHEGLRDKKKAIESYKRCLDLDPEQKEVILKVCELYGDAAVDISPDGAKIWIERAEKYFPNDAVIFKLKEKLVENGASESLDDMEQLISGELVKNPEDVKLHVKLVRLWIRGQDVERAFTHVVDVEKTLAFVSSLPWYECVLDVFQVYADQQEGVENDVKYFTHKLFALASLTALRLKNEHVDMVAAKKALQEFDEALFMAGNIRQHGACWGSLLTEMKGRLFYLMALLLIRRAQKGQVSWKESSSYSLICFLLCAAQPTFDLKSSWYNQLKPERKKFYEHIQMTGCYRLSQAGHMIQSIQSSRSTDQSKLHMTVCTPEGRTALYSLVFTNGGKRKEHSFFLNSDAVTSVGLEAPSAGKRLGYDAVAFNLHGSDLSRLVWLCLQHYNLKQDAQPDYEHLFGVELYPDLKYSVPDLSGSDPATMCQLDVQVFLMLCVRWAAIDEREKRRNMHVITDKPELLPVDLTTPLCTRQQADWWTAVHNMEKGKNKEKLGSAFGKVSRGLETLRLVNPNSLALSLVVHVANTLDARVKEMEGNGGEDIVSPRLHALQTRAAFYWSGAADILDRMDRNIAIRTPKEVYFPVDLVVDPAVAKEMREHVKFAMAIVAMREEKYQEALSSFEAIYKPESSYYAGLIYRRLAEDQDTNCNSSGSNRSRDQMVLLTKSKTALYQTLDRLDSENNKELQDSVKRELDDVVCRLISLETGEDASESFLASVSRQQDSGTQETDEEEDSEPLKHATPRTPSRPQADYPRLSPTRLDVQLKALESTNSALTGRLATLEETVKSNNALIQEILVQLRQARDDNRTLRDQLQIISLQGLTTMPVMRPPSTPQQPRMSQLNMVYGSPAPMPGGLYDFQGQNGLPPHMAQYTMPNAPSPRPGSAYGQPPDLYGNIDGEYHDPESEDFFIQDQNLVQEWPFGHKAGVEGKSTITYSPQPQQPVRAINPAANAGMFAANALRGQAIQYGASYPSLVQPTQPPAAQMPGPGFFSQNSPMQQMPGHSAQGGVIPGTFGMAVRPSITPTGSPATLPVKTTPSVIASTKPVTPMMPPNAVIPSQAQEAKPKLIPGSVGVPVASTKAQSPRVTPAAKPSPVFGSPVTTSALSGSAAAALSNLATKHQEETTKSTSQPPSVPVTTPEKTVFKGFTFTSTPKIAEIKEDTKPKEAHAPTVSTSTTASKPFSGFGGFAFNTPTVKPPTVPVVKTEAQSSFPAQSQGQMPAFGLSPGQASASFGSLATQCQVAASFQAGGDQAGFVGTGTPLFGKSPTPRRRNPSICSDDHVDEYEPNVDFKPVIQLPELVEVKTGEENEERMFCERAKLYRYDEEVNQWKERGIGDIKILKHNETGSVRILMRREQVLKLCANHKINSEMKLSQMASSDKAWVWNAMDFAEGSMKNEKFAVKFKSSDIADKFKTAFEKCRDEMKVEEESKDLQETNEVKPKDVDQTADATKTEKSGNGDLASLFKKKEGSWTCDGCYITSDAHVLKCPCCQSLKPGVKPEDIKSDTGSSSIFGAGSSQGTSGFKFGTDSSTASKPTGSGFQFGEGTAGTAKPASGFTFGTPSTTAASSAAGLSSGGDSKPTGSGFQFGGSTDSAKSASGFTFGTPTTVPTGSGFVSGSSTATTKGATTTTSRTGFTFGSSGSSSGLEFGSTAVSVSTSSSTSEFIAAVSTVESTKDSSGPSSFGTTTAGIFGGAASSSVFGAKTTSEVRGVFGSSSVFTQPTSTTGDGKQGLIFGGGASKTVETLKSTTDGEPKSAGFDTKTEMKDKVNNGESLLAKFLSSPDSWKCETCLISNDGEVSKCVACGEEKSESTGAGKSAYSSVFGQAETQPSAFNFGQAASTDKKSDKGFKFTIAPESDTLTSQPAASLGSGFNFSMSMTPLKKDSPTKSLGLKSPGITSPKSSEYNEEDYYVNKESDDCHIHFEPVIALPDKVEVKTGEEDEEVIFKHRAKLFRFLKGEWKERGLGDVKILYQPNANKARILMRREQILKICCNHYVTPDLKLQPMPNSKGAALIWSAVDFADGEGTYEKFSIKFKNQEIAKEFEKAIDDTKGKLTGAKPKVQQPVVSPKVESLGALDDKGGDVEITKVEKATPEEIEKARKLMLPDHFYMYTRLPDCRGCLGCDDGAGQYCHQAEDQRGEVGHDYEDGDDDEDDDDDDDDDDYEDEDNDEEESYEATDQPETKSGERSDGGSLFGGGSAGGFSFAALAKTSPQTSFKPDPDKPFHWQGAGKQLFGSSAGGGHSDEEGDVQQGEDPQFEPVVPLPDLVEVKTGEEDEVAVFSQRSKLFRFDKDANQWKEKGIGEMKILKHKSTGKYRLLLRREQVHKLACNHALTADMKFEPLKTSETSWIWHAQDYTESQPRLEQFALKFKNVDLARSFKDKIDEIQQELRG